jgi:hypothetical protein
MTNSRAARLVAWGNAWLAGLDGVAGLDDLLDVVQRGDEPHQVANDGDTVPLALGLGLVRASGATRFQLALPVAGDVSSLPGPAPTNRLALEAGEAVLVDGAITCALIPEVTAHGSPMDGYSYAVTWRLVGANAPRPLATTTRGAAVELTEALRQATSALTQLDVAGAGQQVLDALARSRDQRPTAGLPVGHPAAAHELVARCERLETLLDLAAQDDGAAVTQHELNGRSEVLRALAAAVRRAQEVAYSSCEAVAPGRPPAPQGTAPGVLDAPGRS